MDETFPPPPFKQVTSAALVNDIADFAPAAAPMLKFGWAVTG